MSSFATASVYGLLAYAIGNTFVNWHLRGRIDQLEQRVSELEPD